MGSKLYCVILVIFYNIPLYHQHSVENTIIKQNQSTTETPAKPRILYDYQTHTVAFKDLIESKCILEILTGNDSVLGKWSSSGRRGSISKDFVRSELLSKRQIWRLAGDRITEFCRGFPTYLIKNGAELSENELPNYIDKTRKKRTTSHYFQGRIRGQTQSQYLNFGKSDEPGKAEAESTYEGSKAVVSGSNGMGQAQSQSVPLGCDECNGRDQDQTIEIPTRPGSSYQESLFQKPGWSGQFNGPQQTVSQPQSGSAQPGQSSNQLDNLSQNGVSALPTGDQKYPGNRISQARDPNQRWQGPEANWPNQPYEQTNKQTEQSPGSGQNNFPSQSTIRWPDQTRGPVQTEGPIPTGGWPGGPDTSRPYQIRGPEQTIQSSQREGWPGSKIPDDSNHIKAPGQQNEYGITQREPSQPSGFGHTGGYGQERPNQIDVSIPGGTLNQIYGNAQPSQRGPSERIPDNSIPVNGIQQTLVPGQTGRLPGQTSGDSRGYVNYPGQTDSNLIGQPNQVVGSSQTGGWPNVVNGPGQIVTSPGQIRQPDQIGVSPGQSNAWPQPGQTHGPFQTPPTPNSERNVGPIGGTQQVNAFSGQEPFNNPQYSSGAFAGKLSGDYQTNQGHSGRFMGQFSGQYGPYGPGGSTQRSGPGYGQQSWTDQLNGPHDGSRNWPNQVSNFGDNGRRESSQTGQTSFGPGQATIWPTQGSNAQQFNGWPIERGISGPSQIGPWPSQISNGGQVNVPQPTPESGRPSYPPGQTNVWSSQREIPADSSQAKQWPAQSWPSQTGSSIPPTQVTGVITGTPGQTTGWPGNINQVDNSGQVGWPGYSTGIPNQITGSQQTGGWPGQTNGQVSGPKQAGNWPGQISGPVPTTGGAIDTPAHIGGTQQGGSWPGQTIGQVSGPKQVGNWPGQISGPVPTTGGAIGGSQQGGSWPGSVVNPEVGGSRQTNSWYDQPGGVQGGQNGGPGNSLSPQQTGGWSYQTRPGYNNGLDQASSSPKQSEQGSHPTGWLQRPGALQQNPTISSDARRVTQGQVNGSQNSDNLEFDDSDSQVQTSVQQTPNGTLAQAQAQGTYGGGTAQSQVSGTYSGAGSFSASAGSNDGKRGAQTQVAGGEEGAQSSAQGKGGSGLSQSEVSLSAATGQTISSAQSNGIAHGTQSQVQASEKGGLADAQSNGPGSTSSQAQIGFLPSDENDSDNDTEPFRGGGTAGAQSGSYSGMSQSQVQGKFKFGVKYNGAAQAASGGLSFGKNFTRTGPFNPTHINFNASRNELAQRQVQHAAIQKTVSRNIANDSLEGIPPTTTIKPVPAKKSNSNHSNSKNYDDDYYNDDDDDEEETETEKPKVRSIVTQSDLNQRQHIILDPLEDLDLTIHQSKGDTPADGTIVQPGESVPGIPGYKVPAGFRGTVRAIANGPNTYAVGENSQAQSATLSPGTGRIIYKQPFYAVTSDAHSNNGQYGYGSGYTYQPAYSPIKYQFKNGKVLPGFVSMTKSETGSTNLYTGKKTPSVYYTQSSSCGIFTNQCIFNAGKKICFPKAKTNPDGTLMGC